MIATPKCATCPVSDQSRELIIFEYTYHHHIYNYCVSHVNASKIPLPTLTEQPWILN